MTAGLRPFARTRTFVLTLTLFVFSAAYTVAAPSQIEGRVTDPDGRPVAHASIVVSSALGATLRTETDAAGRFVLAGLAAGRYQVLASAPALAADPVDVTVTEEASSTMTIALRVRALSETLIVSASQIDQPLSRTPDSVTVISGQELETRQVFTLGAALRSVAGLNVIQSGGPGTLTSLFTRGGESDYTLVLIDGVRANAFGGGLDLSQVPLQNVERIEVVRGPQSALYGSDAIGGVVQVITRNAGRPTAQAQVEGGSRDMRRASASTSGEVNNIRWQGGADYYDDAGFTGTAANGETVSNDDAQERQVSGGLGWRHAGSGADLQGNLLYVDTDRGSPGPYGSDPAGRYFGVDTISRGTTRRVGGSRPVRAALVRRVEPRAPARGIRRRGLRPDVHEPVRRLDRGVASRARARPDRRGGRRGARLLRRPRVARRAWRQHLHRGRLARRGPRRTRRARPLRRGPVEPR